MVRAMSKVWARMLMAGTVKPLISPRARALYSSWMLADLRPECLAGLPDDPLGGGRGRLVGRERGRPGEVADGGAAEGRLVVDDQQVAVEVSSGADDSEQVG